MFRTLLIVLLGIVLLVLIINLPVQGIIKFAIGVLAMFCISKLLAQRLKIKDESGLLMIRSTAGCDTIARLAGNKEIWMLFADFGSAICYGVLSFFIIKRPIKQRIPIIISGLLAIILISFFLVPSVFPFLFSMLGTKEFALKTTNTGMLFSAILVLAGGFALSAFASLVTYAGVILLTFVNTYFFGTNEFAQISPGATLLLPGINIPFVEGIFALALLLMVHEGAHAILSKVARVRLLSSGVVLFGIIPIGAFVEPDEEILKKQNIEKQTRILVAGSTANFFLSFFAFLIFYFFLLLIAPYKDTISYPHHFIYNVLGLTFSLNFIIAMVNLLPLPFFDGYRILELNLNKKIVVNSLAVISVIAFFVNFLPGIIK